MRPVLLVLLIAGGLAYISDTVASEPETLECLWDPDSLASMDTSEPPVAKVRAKIVFVAFQGDVDTVLPPSLLPGGATLETFMDVIDRQSRGSHELIVDVITVPEDSTRMWVVSSPMSYYRGLDAGDGDYYPCTDADYNTGEWQAEALYRIRDAYLNTGVDPFAVNADEYLQFFFVSRQLWHATLQVGGTGNIYVAIGDSIIQGSHAGEHCLDFLPRSLPPVRYDPPTGGTTTAWTPFMNIRTWGHGVLHEYGHSMFGLTHPVGFTRWDPTLTWYGNYSCMRNVLSNGQGFLPFAPLDLMRNGWHEELVLVTNNLRAVNVVDVRNQGPTGGRIYRMPLPPLRQVPYYYDPLDSTVSRLEDFDQYFLLAFAGNSGEDLQQSAAGPPIYRSRGLEIWHVVERVTDGQTTEHHNSVESAFGKFADPPTWQEPDPTDGIDSLHWWPGRNLDQFGAYPGSEKDFFRPGVTPEFSFRTNPSTFAYSDANGVADGQDLPTSVFIEILQDKGDSLVVDILLAPHEDITFPNGNEVVGVGQPIDITWSDRRSYFFNDPRDSLVVNEVDIAVSSDNGATYDTLAVAVPNAFSYTWIPLEGHAGDSCLVEVTFHNIYDSTRVGVDVSDAPFAVVRSDAEFVNRSGAVGQLFSGSPYSSVAFDFDLDVPANDTDLVVTDKDGTGGILEHGTNLSSPELPDFVDVSVNLAAGDLPDNLRGLVSGDYDNDGDLDLFAASELNARLYRNNTLPAGGPSEPFTDVGESLGSAPLDSLAADSWAGSWCDYNRDGFIDLFIGRADGVTGALQNLMLRNETDGQFQEVTESAGLMDTLATVTASWADFDEDGDPDLFVGDRGISGSRLYVNDGDGTFTDVTEELPVSPTHVAAATWADMDNDADLDLVVSRESTAGVGSYIFWNNAAGGFTGSTDLHAGSAAAGHTLFDHDFSQTMDLLVLPATGEDSLQLWSNVERGNDRHFFNMASAVGLDAGDTMAVFGAVAADFGGTGGDDADLDLYVGWKKTGTADKFFYQNTTAGSGDSPGANWLRVRLEAEDSGNNYYGIGSLVTVEVPASSPQFSQTRVVDGGSGRGGQSPIELSFGLGDLTGPAKVTVRWPDRFVQVLDTLSVNTEAVIVDDHAPGLLQSSISGLVQPKPSGKADWVFSWETTYSSKQSWDKVRIECTNCGKQPQCSVGGGAVVLTKSTATVTYTYSALADTTLYEHSIRWNNRDCDAPCSYRYRVTSASGTKSQTSSWKTLTVPVCVQ